MFKTFTLAITALFLCANLAHAADDCATQASDKKLAGAAKSSYMKKCSADAVTASPAAAGCEKAAGEKKLAGAAKSSYLKKCSADGGPAAAATAASAPSPLSTPAAPLASAPCDKQAGEKKLAGAAKTSFMKKCNAEAK